MVTEKAKTDPESNSGSPASVAAGPSVLPPGPSVLPPGHSVLPPGYNNGVTVSNVPVYPSSVASYIPQEPPLPQKQEHLTVVIGRAKEHKSLMDAYILWFPLGILGFHHFYLRRPEVGLVYFFTLGLCGIGWIVDLFRMPQMVKEANKKIDRPDDFHPLTVTDAYVFWFPFGILGFHHYYLRQPAWGLLYTFTAGLFGIGWLIDACRIPGMVKDANVRLEREFHETNPKHVRLCDAYALGATPLGIFGAHHFYMGRHGFGLFYLFTLGGCGIGWITDWFRMKCLVDRTNNPLRHRLGKRHKYLDDAYVLAFPLGVLGTHHFYLERPGWGVLYFFTLGLGGVGWLVDLIRMPWLVSATNKRLEEEMSMIEDIRGQIGAARCTINTRDVRVQSTMAAHPESISSYGSLGETPVLGPPPYTPELGGYSGYGHVYTVPAPNYTGHPYPGVHGQQPLPNYNPYPGLSVPPTVHENQGFKGEQA